jgi:mannose-6-phosphate isomerase-like protein (cupin superfamily)
MARRDALKALDAPTVIRRRDVQLVLWGDDESGYVNDLFYVLSREMVLTTICMPPGGGFTSSDRYQPFYDTHEGLYVLSGQYTLRNPVTGEVRVAEAGQMVLMRELQWHYGYNLSDVELRLLETIAPPASQKALMHHPRPEEVLGADRAALADWPRSRELARTDMDVVDEKGALSVLIGAASPVLLRVLASTPRMSLAIVELGAGRSSEWLAWRNDATLYVERGRLNVRVPEADAWEEIFADDVFFLPAGTRHQIRNMAGDRCRAILSLAGNLAGQLPG